LAKGDYVDLLINGQVIGLGRVEYEDTRTYYGRERVDADYVTVLIIDVTQPHLILEDVDEGDINPWKIMDLRHNIGANVSFAFSSGDKVDLLQCGVKVGEGA
jgi:hypothetical protein